jgi:hypothetical protein
MSATLTIPARFNGPPASGNGGFSAGRVAAQLTLTAPVEVTIRRPVPLGTELAVELDGPAAGLVRHDGELIAEARVVAPSELGAAVAPVPFAQARAAAAQYPGLESHPFPTCFVCGPGRPARDGLEVFAGPIDGDPTYIAAAFVLRPEHDRAPEFVWAALDCPGGWAMDQPNRPAVLGRVTGLVLDVPAIGEQCVVVGTLDGWDGRKAFTRTTAYGADGRELGRTRSTWIELDRRQQAEIYETVA